MSSNPIDLVGGLTTSSNVVKADLVALLKARMPLVLADANEVRSTLLAGQIVVTVKTLSTYYQDTTDTTTADDGINCIISSDSKRFKPLAILAGANLFLGDGLVGAPAYTFALDPDTGLYRIGANEIGIAAGGAKVVDISTAGVAITGTLTYGGVTLAGAVTGTGNMVLSIAPTLAGATLSAALTYGGVTLANAVTGTGNMVLSSSPTLAGATLSAALTYGGVTLANTVTGTGSMVLSASPTFTGTLGAAAIIATGLLTAAGASLSAALTYGGVTLANAVTGTGNMVLSAGPTLTGTITAANLAASGSILSSGTAGIGYATGAGGTVTQATNKAAAVTLSKITGLITMNAAALAAATIVFFPVTNTLVAATDHVMVSHESGGTLGAYTVNGRATGAGALAIDVRNNTAGSLSEAIVLRVTIIKSVNA